MSKAPNFRIIERHGEVHVQQQTTFLGLRWWSTIEVHYLTGRKAPVNYGTVEEAKKAIDRARKAWEVAYSPEVITYYPA